MEDVVIEVLIESGIAEIEIIEGIWNIGISDRRETIKEAKGGVYVSKLNILQQLIFMITFLPRINTLVNTISYLYCR